MPIKISQAKPPQSKPAPQQPTFNVQAAMQYNAKSEQYFKRWETDIKRVLNTTADWKSQEFAQAVYDWQQKNGFTGNWVDGKFGPATMGKIAKVDSAIAQSYDAYAPWKEKHINDKPYQRVINLTSEVNKIRNDMNATDIPLPMLMGWIQVESGGKVSSRGLESLDERGLFQLSRDEANAIGADHDKIGTDLDYSIRSGIQLIRYRADRIDQVLAKYPRMSSVFTKGSDLYWKLVMFSFSAGTGTADELLARIEQSGEQISNWEDVMKFAAANPGGFKHSPVKWSYHVNRAFNLGNQIVGVPPAVATKIYRRIKNARFKARALALRKLAYARTFIVDMVAGEDNEERAFIVELLEDGNILVEQEDSGLNFLYDRDGRLKRGPHFPIVDQVVQQYIQEELL